MGYNPSRKCIGKPLTNTTTVMQNIGFTTSPYSTTFAPEKLEATIEKKLVTHYLLIIIQWFFISIVVIHSFLSS